MKLQKLGGYASIALVFLNIVMLGSIINIVRGLTGLDLYDPAKTMTAYHASTIGFWTYYVLSILTGILTLLVTMALQERMQVRAPNLMRLAVIAVSIYAALTVITEMSSIYRNVLIAQMNDDATFRAFLVLHECLYFAAVFAMGWEFLLIGWAALRTRALPQTLGYIFLAYGLLSISQFAFSISLVPAGHGVWRLVSFIVFIWLGVVLLRKPEPSLAQT